LQILDAVSRFKIYHRRTESLERLVTRMLKPGG
jgi:hypothetical protein